MKNQQVMKLFSSAQNTTQWDSLREKIDPKEHIKIGELTPEMKENSKKVVDETLLLIKEHLGLLTTEEKEEIEKLKNRLNLQI